MIREQNHPSTMYSVTARRNLRKDTRLYSEQTSSALTASGWISGSASDSLRPSNTPGPSVAVRCPGGVVDQHGRVIVGTDQFASSERREGGPMPWKVGWLKVIVASPSPTCPVNILAFRLI